MVDEQYSIISLVVEDEPGVLARISTMFARKGYNIETVNVGKIPGKDLASIIFTVRADSAVLEQIIKQTGKLVHVLSVNIHSSGQSVVREHCLVRFDADAEKEKKLLAIAKKHAAIVLHEDKHSVVLELVDYPEKVDAFVSDLMSLEAKEIRRSGINAVTKNGFD